MFTGNGRVSYNHNKHGVLMTWLFSEVTDMLSLCVYDDSSCDMSISVPEAVGNHCASAICLGQNPVELVCHIVL